MTLVHCRDLGAAAWLARSISPTYPMSTLGPAGYEAYVRLRLVPDPTAPGQDEGDVEVPDDHISDLAQAQRALSALARFTATPQDC